MSLRYWLLIIFIGSIWGCSFLFNAILIRELGPVWVSAGRVSIAAIASWGFVVALKRSIPRDPVLIGKLMLLGIFSYAIPFTLYPLGQQVIPSGLTAIINALTPIMTVIVSHFWIGGEKASTNKSLGVLAGFIGAALIAWPALADGGTTRLWGIGACLMATVLYAITLNAARSFKAIDPTIIATIALTGASIAAVPVALLSEGLPHVTHVETWAAWLALGLISTALAFQIMYRLLPRIGATNFASNTFIAPVVAILLGVTLLGETLQPSHYMGMFAIFIGLLMIDGRLVRRWQSPASA